MRVVGVGGVIHPSRRLQVVVIHHQASRGTRGKDQIRMCSRATFWKSKRAASQRDESIRNWEKRPNRIGTGKLHHPTVPLLVPGCRARDSKRQVRWRRLRPPMDCSSAYKPHAGNGFCLSSVDGALSKPRATSDLISCGKSCYEREQWWGRGGRYT